MSANLGQFFTEEKRTNLDLECLDCIETNINLAIPWYLMASYAYYKQDDPILTDAAYDRLAKRILEEWDNINHIHKKHLTVDMLKAGCYIGEYPSRVAGGLKTLKEVYHGKNSTGTHSGSSG
jgi:hypothetical protein